MPIFAWVCRVIAVGLIGYGVFSAMHTAAEGSWKYGRTWPHIPSIWMGGCVLLMTFAWRARTRKRAIVLFCIAFLFIVIGMAMQVASVICAPICVPGIIQLSI